MAGDINQRTVPTCRQVLYRNEPIPHTITPHTHILTRVPPPPPTPHSPGLDIHLIPHCKPALPDNGAEAEPVYVEMEVQNVHRAVGTTLSHEVTKRFGDKVRGVCMGWRVAGRGCREDGRRSFASKVVRLALRGTRTHGHQRGFMRSHCVADAALETRPFIMHAYPMPFLANLHPPPPQGALHSPTVQQM
jgi:hypothetical protein